MIKFQLGQLVATSGVNENESMIDVLTVVNRHVNGDWGDLDKV